MNRLLLCVAITGDVKNLTGFFIFHSLARRLLIFGMEVCRHPFV